MNTRQARKKYASSLNRLIEFIIYTFFDIWILFWTKKTVKDKGAVALLYMELMGDYFVWLPYGKELCEKLLHSGHNLIFICNSQWAPLAKQHYPECQIMTIDKSMFLKNPKYRSTTLRSLNLLGVSRTLHPSHPRAGAVEDACIRALDSHSIGFDATFSDRPLIDRLISRRLYATLLPSMPGVHQAVRYETFVQAVITSAPLFAPPLACSSNTLDEGFKIDGPYFVVSPGASHTRKAWHRHGFMEIIKRTLTLMPEWKCVLVGSPAEQEWIDAMQRQLGPRVLSLAGRNSLPQLVNGIRYADLVISNDSAAAHIAAACGTPSLAILNGAEYGRCQPYDPIRNAVACVPETIHHPMACYGCDWNCRYSVIDGDPVPCLASIGVEQAWEKLNEMLPARKS